MEPSKQSSQPIPTQPHISSPYNGLSVSHHQLPPYEFKDWVGAHYAIDLNLHNSYYLEWKDKSRFHQGLIAPDSMCISPAHAPLSMRWKASPEIIKVRIEPTWLLKTAEEMKVKGEVEILEQHGSFDQQISFVCQALWAEAKAGYPSGRLFGDSLATALSSSLLQRHSARRGLPPQENKLSPRRWNLLREYIEVHLENDISLDDMATIVQLSPYHFSRCFKITVGTSPHQYLISRRIERARQLLLNTQLPLAQIASQCGFADQSHLARHMKKALGVTPTALLSQHQK